MCYYTNYQIVARTYNNMFYLDISLIYIIHSKSLNDSFFRYWTVLCAYWLVNITSVHSESCKEPERASQAWQVIYDIASQCCKFYIGKHSLPVKQLRYVSYSAPGPLSELDLPSSAWLYQHWYKACSMHNDQSCL